MEYDNVLRKQILDSLENRLSSIAFSIKTVYENGYILSQKTENLFSITQMLIEAYKNINSVSKENQDKLDEIYNKLLTL